MKKLHFSIRIEAPREMVWSTMLGEETYQAWTEPFCEGSRFEGSWEAGERIRFLAPNGDGMTSVIAENRPQEFISIKHLGVIHGGVEDKDSEQARQWAPAYENYRFLDADGGTEVRVEQDTIDEYERYMLDIWPKALERLKALCEAKVGGAERW